MMAGGLTLGALLVWGSTSVHPPAARPAVPPAAPAVDAPSAAVVVEPLVVAAPAAAPSPADTARVRDLQERLFAAQVLTVVGNQVLRGGAALPPDAFYTTIERPDVLGRMRARRTGKAIARSIGIAALVIGGVWGIVDVTEAVLDNGINRAVNLCPSGDTSMQCARRSSASALPWLVAGGGLITLLAAVAVPTDPLGHVEKQRLADEYNQRLRASFESPRSSGP